MPKKLIYKVDSVNLSLNKSNPPQLVVTANGTTRSSAWHDFELELIPNKPLTGVYDFDFGGLLPVDHSLPVTTPTGDVSYTFEKIPSDLAKITVKAETNSISVDYKKEASSQKHTANAEKLIKE